MLNPDFREMLLCLNDEGVDEAWRSRVKITISDLEVEVLSKEVLLQNKLAAGRDKDQGDINWLKRINP